MSSITSHQNSAAEVIRANEVVVHLQTSNSQAGSSQQIGESLTEFENSTKVHVSSTMVMDEVLIKLARQINSLQNEMEHFKVQS